MAAAAYGTVVSLMHVLDNLKHPSRQHLYFDRYQIGTLSKRISSLLDLLEEYSQILCRPDTEDLGRQIAFAVDEAEEVIDYHVVNQLAQRSAYEVEIGFSSFREDLDRALNKIESLMKELVFVKDQEMVVERPTIVLMLPASSTDLSIVKINTMVGFDDRLEHIMEQLTSNESDLQIVSITGMGGIGKTTLAQNVFNHRCIVERFDLRKWITISQSYKIQDVLLGLVGETNGKSNQSSAQLRETNGKSNQSSAQLRETNGKSNQSLVQYGKRNQSSAQLRETNGKSNQSLAELSEKLHKMFFGRRYLIVMDDVWSTEIWDNLKRCLPNNKNNSRILMTSRLSRIAASLTSHKPFWMDFLDEGNSWILFCMKTFGVKVCPYPNLEKIGKNIVKCCKGLPLAITIIGGLLGKSNMKRDYWEFISKDVLKSLSNPKDDVTPVEIDDHDCSKILSLSYKHLPINLKSCFLYMRMFREDEVIDVEDLISYWIVEGFVKPKVCESETLEEVAYEYLKDLIDRNLILIHQLNLNTGDISQCRVHDLLRDLSVREYEKESFFRMSKVGKIHERNGYAKIMEEDTTCFLCCYREASTWVDIPRFSCITPLPTLLVSCFVCSFCNVMCANHDRLRLVNVAYDVDENVDYLKPTRLRYLEINGDLELGYNALHLLWNLQHLDVHTNNRELPNGVWNMPQIIHLDVRGASSVDSASKVYYFYLENLELLKVILHFGSSKEILERIPNVKTLDITYSKYLDEALHNVSNLHALNFLTCRSFDLEYVSFPNSLKILYLEDGICPWERMTIIGSLPNLQVLHLLSTHGGPEWIPIEGDFPRLKTLIIEDNDLVQWNAEKEHFPRLETLVLDTMECLEKIPSGIGDVETLCKIWLISATESVVQSAKEIIEEQCDYGNEELQLIIE